MITGFNDTFYTNASGSDVENFVYTWYRNNSIIPNVTTINYQPTATGIYKVHIENSWGEYLESPSVEVRGLGGHTYIVTQPVSVTTHNLQTTLSAEVEGTGTITTQWYENGVIISGATNNSLVVDSVSGNYKYIASTNYETVTSDSVTVQLTAINSFYSAKFSSGTNYITKSATLEHTLSSNDFTIEAWVNPSTNTGYKFIVGVGENYDGVGWLLYTEVNGSLNFICNGMGWNLNSSVGYTAAQKLTPNKWQHVAVTRSNNNVRLFLDGVMIQEKAFSGVITTYHSQIRCGQWIYQASGDLKVTDLRIVKGQALYESNFVAPYAKLTSTGYSFDSYYHNKLITINQNITGTILELELQDSTFNSNWTKVGRPVITADSNWYLDDVALINQFSGVGDNVQGRDGAFYSGGYRNFLDGYMQGYYPYRYLWYPSVPDDPAWTFATSFENGLPSVYPNQYTQEAVVSAGDFIFNDTLYNVDGGMVVTTAPVSTAGTFSKVLGTSDSAVVRLSKAINAGDFTFEAYVKLDVLNSNQCIFDMPYSNGQYPYNGYVVQYYNNTFRTYSGPVGVSGGVISNLNEWYHVASVRQDNVLSLYINGIRQQSISNTYSITKQDLTIGKHATLDSSYAWNGKITNVRVSNIARYSGDYFNSEFTPFIRDNNTLALAFQTNSLEGFVTPTGTVSSSPLSPWYLDKIAKDSSFTGVGDGLTTGQYGYVYNNGTLTNHPYYINSFWLDQQTIQNGLILYTKRHTDTVASSVLLQADGDQLINTNASGVVSTNTLTRSMYSRYFDNVSYGYLNDPTKADYNSAGFTIEFWVKLNSTNRQHVIFTRNGGSANWSNSGHQYTGFLYQSMFWFQYSTGGGYQVSLTTSALTANTWYHIAVAFDGTSTRVYKDGIFQSSSITPYYTGLTLTQFLFGKDANSNSSTFLNGYLSNFRFIRGQALYVTPSFAVPNAALTDTGYGNINQGITGTVTVKVFQSPQLENLLTTVNTVASSNESPLIFKDFASTLQYTGYGNNNIGRLNYEYTTGAELHHPYSIYNAKFIDVSSVDLINNGSKLFTNYYSSTAVAINTFVYGGLSAFVTNLSGEFTAIEPTTHASRYFENGTNTDGQGTIYKLPSADLDFGTSDFTIEFWSKQIAKPDNYNRTFVFSAPAFGFTFNPGHSTWGANRYSFEAWKGGATWASPGDQTNYYNSITNETLVYNTWKHFAICKQGSHVYLYIDGVLKPESTLTVDGRSWTFTEGYFGYMYGFASNLRIIKGQALYTSNFNVPNAELTNTGYGTVNQGITGIVTRYLQSTNIESGCVNQGSVSSNESPFLNYKTYGVNFDGNNQWITTTYTAIGTDNFTYEAFINIKRLSDNQNIIDYPILIGHYTNGKFGIYNRTNDKVMYTSENAVQIGQWMHIALVRNSNTTTFYVNGSAAAIGTGTDWTSNLTSTTGYIGKFFNTGSYTFGLNGAVSNVRLIKNQALYTTNFTVPSADLTTTGYGNVNQNITGNIVLLGVNQPIYKTNTRMFNFSNCSEPSLVSLF